MSFRTSGNFGELEQICVQWKDELDKDRRKARMDQMVFWQQQNILWELSEHGLGWHQCTGEHYMWVVVSPHKLCDSTQQLFPNTRQVVAYFTFTDSCPVGTLNNIGTQTCEPCSPGFYQNQADQLFCYPCPAGYYQNLRGSTFCYACEFGFYQNDTNSEFCYKCPDDRTTFVRDATNISQCFGEAKIFNFANRIVYKVDPDVK